MLRKLFTFFFIGCLACLQVQGSKSFNNNFNKIKRHDWIDKPYTLNTNNAKKEFASVGSSNVLELGLKHQIIQAENDGKLSINKELTTYVQSKLSNIIKRYVTTGVKQITIDINAILLEIMNKVELKDAMKTHIWQDPVDNKIYTRVAIDKILAIKSIIKALSFYTNNDQNYVYLI